MFDQTGRSKSDRYMVRRKIFTLLGAAFHVYNERGELLLYSRQKAFRLKEDIRLFTGEDMQTEVLRIAARRAIDFSAAYDVYDPIANEKVGVLQRRGFRSIVRDAWMVLDASDREIATVQEDSTAAALVRRFIQAAALFLPQKHHVEMDGRTVGTFKQNINPFVLKIEVDLSWDPERRLDRRLGVAAAILLAAVEGRQES